MCKSFSITCTYPLTVGELHTTFSSQNKINKNKIGPNLKIYDTTESNFSTRIIIDKLFTKHESYIPFYTPSELKHFLSIRY